MKKESKQIILTAPGGENQKVFLDLLEIAGCFVERPIGKSYTATVEPNGDFDNRVKCIFTRANEAVTLMEENYLTVAAATTGKDILYEQSVESDRVFDLGTLLPWLPSVFLDLYATPNGLQYSELVRLADAAKRQFYALKDQTPEEYQALRVLIRNLLAGSIVNTSRRRRIKAYFDDDPEIDIKFRAGKIEGLGALNNKYLAYADVVATGRTGNDNGNRRLATVERVNQLGLVLNPMADPDSKQVITQLADRITKITSRFPDLKSSANSLVSVSDIATVGNSSICIFFMKGIDDSSFYGKTVPFPIFFDDQVTTVDQAKQLLGVEGYTYFRETSDLKSLFQQLEKVVDPVVLYLITQVVEKGGYIIVPSAIIKYFKSQVRSESPGYERCNIH